ncbi:MAG: hypothetical protein GY789_27945 [Hyphomicrobiales bacterium]|nr:hypothetical protein [Hyphomicrobiales bacterium]MCP4997970.1 hypothetical protein [Hyphomicrobiales bacterium]
MRRIPAIAAFTGLVAWLVHCDQAAAHVSEQGFVLLLPTGVYRIAGVAAVAASIVIVSLAPPAWMRSIFVPYRYRVDRWEYTELWSVVRTVTSVASLCLLLGLIVIGVAGTRDPLSNLLPLTIWTVWWIAIVMLHCVFGNIWSFINPWTGAYRLVIGPLEQPGLIKLPDRLGSWPAVPILVAFFAFAIADPAPDDPARLANFVLGYLILTFAGMALFGGQTWLSRCECFTLLFRLAASIAPLKMPTNGNRLSLGLPGWRALQGRHISYGMSFFALSLLASGSFDGVNETFWWLAQIGVNPLEFPGRSAVVTQSVMGLITANFLLFAIFSGCVWCGVKLTVSETDREEHQTFKVIFCRLALSVLPIAFAYHGSHYLVSFLVNGQYVIAALSDPLATGVNYLGLDNYQVTTGFLNSQGSVRRIWLSQAGLIVTGHILAVLMAHSVVTKIFRTTRQILLCHTPIALFMIAYTWFGLWLLAAPRGA